MLFSALLRNILDIPSKNLRSVNSLGLPKVPSLRITSLTITPSLSKKQIPKGFLLISSLARLTPKPTPLIVWNSIYTSIPIPLVC